MVGGCTSLCTKCACVSSWHHAVGVVVVVFVAAAEVAVAVAVVVVVVVGATTAANQETKARKTSSYDEKLAQNPPRLEVQRCRCWLVELHHKTNQCNNYLLEQVRSPRRLLRTSSGRSIRIFGIGSQCRLETGDEAAGAHVLRLGAAAVVHGGTVVVVVVVRRCRS